ncbi:hypothetical protein KP509_22G018400 [Ceratopteris richardii]|uniref:Uncharacterized protein n=1 Tax=Ceratopteris richardii TaxID=49495 RepID=A0A8T2S344_CERRI|nr:hypothetical protein KP509_22G018400 [Ceratopteris richardii]
MSTSCLVYNCRLLVDNYIVINHLCIDLLGVRVLICSCAYVCFSPSEPEPYAYGQWVAFQLSYIRNASLPWGKWYDYPDKDREVAAPNGQAIAPGSILYVAACGRENSPSGTEGTFEIWSSTSKVAHVYFDCPWSGSNKLEINRFSTQYLLDFNTAPSSGPIGIIPFAIYQK